MARSSRPLVRTEATPESSLRALVALLTLLTLELVRSSGPLLDVAYGEGGVLRVARDAVLTYLAPGPLAALLLFGARRRGQVRAGTVLVLGVTLLAALRLLVQLLDGADRAPVGLATVAVGIAVLTIALGVLVGGAGSGRSAAAAVSLGAAGGVGLQLSLGTWDAYWRHTALGWTVTLILVAAALGLALHTGWRLGPARLPRVPRLWTLGPFLALSAMLLANPAFAASQTGLPLAVAGPLQALGLLVAALLVAAPLATRGSWSGGTRGGPGRARARTVTWLAAAAMPALVLAVFSAPAAGLGRAAVVLLGVLVTQALAVGALGRALQAGLGPGQGRAARTVVTGALLVGLLTIVPLLAYQVDYDLPLGFPNQLVLVATGAALGLGGAVHPGRARPARAAVQGAGPVPPDRRAGWWPLPAATAALVLLGTVLAGLGGFTSTHGPQRRAATGRVLTWNLHYGVAPGGSVDLESTARVIEAADPDVVLLQEVSRGWVLGGGVDMASWLADRLDRRFVFAPAADGQFGNVILTRDPPTDVAVQSLPYGAGPQHRSAVTARVRLGDRSVLVTSVHLQHRAANTPTRLLELETLLAALGPDRRDAPARLIGGDLNATPGSPELRLAAAAGFVSAVDTAGRPDALTSPSVDPVRRIDWVLGRGVAFREARVLTGVRTSDHLPVLATAGP